MTGFGYCLRLAAVLWILPAGGGWALDLACMTACPALDLACTTVYPALDLACGWRAGVWGRDEEARQRARICTLNAGAWWRDEDAVKTAA